MQTHTNPLLQKLWRIALRYCAGGDRGDAQGAISESGRVVASQCSGVIAHIARGSEHETAKGIAKKRPSHLAAKKILWMGGAF
jgi:hypothetical protein